jgi:hypothetical protein
MRPFREDNPPAQNARAMLASVIRLEEPVTVAADDAVVRCPFHVLTVVSGVAAVGERVGGRILYLNVGPLVKPSYHSSEHCAGHSGVRGEGVVACNQEDFPPGHETDVASCPVLQESSLI